MNNLNKPGKLENIITPENKIKNGVDFVFELNPALAQIGTKEQYSKYLDTIFPESKIKDIVYHGGSEKIEEFSKDKLGENTKALSAQKGFFFSTNKDLSITYISNEKWEAVNELKNLMEKYQNDFKNLEDEYNVIASKQRELWDKSQNIITKLIDSLKKLSNKNFVTLEEKYKETIEKSEKAWAKIESYKKLTPPDRLPEIWDKDFFDKYRLKREINDDKQLYGVLLNIQNPYVIDNEIENTDKFFSTAVDKAIENNNDSVIMKNVLDVGGWVTSFDSKKPLDSGLWNITNNSMISKDQTLVDKYKGDDLVVFESEQIYILGSKQDIEGFKKFIFKN